jgi:hypothetical protein
MIEQDFEVLSQYLDGELSAADTQQLRHRLMAEPDLRAALNRLQAVNDALVAELNSAEASAVPNEVEAMLAAPKRSHSKAGWGFAIAASLLASSGLLLAPQYGQIADQSANQDSQLASVLEQAPSRSNGWEQLADGRQFRAVLSFSDDSGHWCREYLMNENIGSTLRGIACRDDGQWQTVVASQDLVPGSSTDYRPAGASQADAVAEYVDSHATDIPLSLAQEASLIANDWQ